MITMNNIVRYPDGTDKLAHLLSVFPALMREQIVVFFLQTEVAFNRTRVNDMLNDLEKMEAIQINDDIVSLSKATKKNDDVINAFWVFLHYVNENTGFDKASYPSEIVFHNDDTTSEIIVCHDDIVEKMDFLDKRYKRSNKSYYYFLVMSDTIEDLDDDTFPNVPFSIITVSGKSDKGIPKMVFHNVFDDEIESNPVKVKPQKEKPAETLDDNNDSENEYVDIEDDGYDEE